MVIGIVPELRAFTGGIYQYGLTMLQALHESSERTGNDRFVVFTPKKHWTMDGFAAPHWSVQPLDPPKLKWKMVNGLRVLLGEERVRMCRSWMHRLQNKPKRPDQDHIRLDKDRTGWFRRYGVELMIYPAPTPLSFETGIPYVMAIHDLQHRLQPEFPEVSAYGEWERREHTFRNGARHATLLVADSEVGKEDILNCYGPFGVTEDRVMVLPYLPTFLAREPIPESEVERIRAQYSLPTPYLFYPAQFWSHKNHARLIQGLDWVKQRHGVRIPLVLCGSSVDQLQKDTLQEAQSLARELGLEEQVFFLGYVPDKDMAGLYSGARALAMPTFFGPTNIPVLEAWSFGCPVLTSNIRGIREQMGDAAYLVDPRSVEEIAVGIHRLWTDSALRCMLAKRGLARLSGYTSEDYRTRLLKIIGEAKERVRMNSTQGSHIPMEGDE